VSIPGEDEGAVARQVLDSDRSQMGADRAGIGTPRRPDQRRCRQLAPLDDGHRERIRSSSLTVKRIDDLVSIIEGAASR
jgi:hypothetical protein